MFFFWSEERRRAVLFESRSPLANRTNTLEGRIHSLDFIPACEARIGGMKPLLASDTRGSVRGGPPRGLPSRPLTTMGMNPPPSILLSASPRHSL